MRRIIRDCGRHHHGNPPPSHGRRPGGADNKPTVVDPKLARMNEMAGISVSGWTVSAGTGSCGGLRAGIMVVHGHGDWMEHPSGQSPFNQFTSSPRPIHPAHTWPIHQMPNTPNSASGISDAPSLLYRCGAANTGYPPWAINAARMSSSCRSVSSPMAAASASKYGRNSENASA